MKRILSFILLLSLAMGMMAQKTTAYVVNASSLNVRQEPATNAKIIGKVTNGQLVQVLNIKNGWAYIYYGKSTGYVSAQYLVKKGSSASSSKTSTTSTNNKSTTQKSTASNKSSSAGNSGGGRLYSDGRGAHYAGWLETGSLFTKSMGGAELSMVHGCQIRDYIFTGAGVGAHTCFSGGAGIILLPIYADVCAYIRPNEYVAPYIDLGIGGYYGWSLVFLYPEYNSRGGGFYMHAMAGVQFASHYTISIGYERIGANCGTVRFSYCW